MPSRSFLALTAVASSFLVGCGSDVDSDAPLGDQLDADEREQFVTGFVEGAGGSVARSEAECVSNAMFDAGLTFDEIMASQTEPAGRAANVLSTALPTCIDPSLDISVPLEGDVRIQIEGGLMSSGLSGDQASCLLDAYTDAGIDARDLFVAGVEPSAELDAISAEAFATCG